MGCNSKLLHKIHEKKNYLFLTKNPIVLHTKSIKRPSLCHPSLVLVHVNLTLQSDTSLSSLYYMELCRPRKTA